MGIPAGGLFSGAEDAKTVEEAEIYGGEAGAPHDPCYHESCDSLNPVYDDPDDAALYTRLAAEYPLIGNVNLQALDELSDGAAHATLVFAEAKGPVGKQSSTQGIQTAMKGPSPTE